MFVIILHPIYFSMPHFREKMKFGITIECASTNLQQLSKITMM